MSTTKRNMASTLAVESLQAIQAGTLRYTWRGVPCVKNPFDFALYSLLVWHAKPATIIEIGSNAGGSALWFADMLRVFGLPAAVVSLDIAEVKGVSDPKIRFLVGDANNLGKTLTRELLSQLPRPWLVVEDSSHQYSTCLHVLRFFDPLLQAGEYLVVEDGTIDDLGIRDQYDGGPNRAIKEFIEGCDGRFAIDSAFCDYFGHNVTWNTNGYLRRVK
jgi:cephalosporin hydroxylase